MNRFDKAAAAIIFVDAVLIVVALFLSGCAPVNRAVANTGEYIVQKVDDATSYRTKKEVEDTCRAMIASYEADCLTWRQYKDSDSAEKQSWAEQAKMRSNKTASTYNNFILVNSYVWSGNVPQDIRQRLEFLE